MDQHTGQQDQDTRRNQVKAYALNAVAETLLVVAPLAVGLTIYYLLANGPQAIAVIGAIAVAIGTDSFLRPMFTDAFGPTIDRLLGRDTKGAEQ